MREGYDPGNEWALIANGGSSTLDTEGRNSGRLFTTYMEPSMPSQRHLNNFFLIFRLCLFSYVGRMQSLA